MRWCTIGQIHNKSLVIIGKSNVCTAARRHSSINFLRKSLLALAVLSAISMHYARKDTLCGTQMDQNISLCDLFLTARLSKAVLGIAFVVCHFVCHSLKFLSISSSFSFRQVSTCFQNRVKSFRQVWTCLQNRIKSYHSISTSLDMF